MRYLIDFKNSASQQDVDTYLSTNNCTVIQEWDNFDRVYLVEIASVPPSADIIERMTEEVGLKIKPLDVIKHDTMDPYHGCHANPTKPKITVSTTDNKDWWKNYSYTAPKFDTPSYELSRLGKNIDIYLMDSGIEASHPEFVDANIVNLYTVTPGDFGDTKGHGTALASVMVGKTCGISDATVKNVKIYQTGHDTLQSEFLSALDAIINDHVDGKWAIVNCSWIIEKNEYIEHKLRLLDQEGVFIVASAGNQGTSIEDVTPASMMEALTVGAYNKDLLPCDFSNYTGTGSLSVTAGAVNHGELDGWAPGEDIYVASLGGGYQFSAGTSIASAITSAIIASNISWYAFDDGQAHPWYSDTVAFGTNSVSPTASNYQYVFCFNKSDMLDLTDPKYADSKNIIASMNDICVRPQTQLPDEFVLSARTGLSSPMVCGGVYVPNMTKQIEWVTPLPDNFQVIPDGLLLGMPSFEQGPAAGEISKTYTATFNRTNIDDTVELVTIILHVVPQELTAQDVPDDADPTIKISLQITCNGNTPQCFIASIYGCNYGCAGGVPCCAIQCGKGFYDCFCAFC